MAYPKIPYVVGNDKALLQCGRVADKVIKIRRALPGNVIVIHGVNDVGTSYKAIEDGLCAGLCTRLGRTFTPATYRQPKEEDKNEVEPDPDAVFFKRTIVAETNSPIIPFYWGFREVREKRKVVNGQFTDRYGTRLDKDLSKGGGPFINATSTLPDMWNRGAYAPIDPGGDPIRPLKTAPGRLYMVLAAMRLAALISMIRDYDKEETVSIVAHSQGCMVTLLAQAILMEKGLAPADTLILTHPPYGLEENAPLTTDLLELFRGGEDGPMEPHYEKIDGRQTLHARLQTLVNIVAGVAGKSGSPRIPEFADLNNDCDHHGMVGSGWKAEADRDNRGKVYLYFSPEDMTVALENIQGIGWQGVPDLISGTEFKAEQETVYDYSTGRRKPMGPFRNYPRTVTRQALQELGASFRQRVFTAKQRLDPTGKVQPVLVGLPAHDFALRLKGEDDFSHVESSVHSLRMHHAVAQWPIDTRNSMTEQRNGIRSINGEALHKPVVADLVGSGQLGPKSVPKGSSHARLAAKDQGPCEEVDPIDAAIAVSNIKLNEWIEERPDPTGVRHPSRSGEADSMTTHMKVDEFQQHQLKEMTERYNKEKHLGEKDTLELRTIVRAYRLPSGQVLAHVRESPNDARLRWQREVSAKSFHGGIIGNAKNHENVTAYDVAIGGGKASSDPKFYAYLCAVADWRLKKPSRGDKKRQGILLWKDFRSKFDVYWKVEPGWRSGIIEGNADYYSNGNLPAGLPLLSGPLWSIIVSELTNGRRLGGKDKP